MTLAEDTAIGLLRAIPRTFRSFGITHVAFDIDGEMEFATSEREAQDIMGERLASVWELGELIAEIEEQSELPVIQSSESQCSS